MSAEVLSNGGAVPKISDVHVVALYDPKNGRIRHVHTVTVFEGGRTINEKQAIEYARSHAADAGLKLENLEIKTSKDPTHGRVPHRIDLKSKEFVALPMPAIKNRRR
jgi:hypothetical protein